MFVVILFAFSCVRVRHDIDVLNAPYFFFEKTPEWPLAEAIRDQDTSAIFDLVREHRAWLYARDPKLNQNLLQLSIITLKYNSAKALLALGASP